MHKKTLVIIKNLGFTEQLVQDIKQESKTTGGSINRKIIKLLKEAGTPETAIDQIRSLELKKKGPGRAKKTNKELIESLIGKCKRSFNSFAKKGIQATFIFKNKKWGVQADLDDETVVSFIKSCQKYFNYYALKGVDVTIKFTGTPEWGVHTKKQNDLPDNI